MATAARPGAAEAPCAGGAATARHDRAAQRARAALVHKGKLFRENLWRYDLLPSERDVALLICADTLDLGFTSMVYRKLEDLVMEPGEARPVLNYGRNDISKAFRGEKGQGGLVRHGLVRLEAWPAEGHEYWLVSVVTEAARWRARERVSVERLAARRGAQWALRAQCVAFLPCLAPEPDLEDALEDLNDGATVAPPEVRLATGGSKVRLAMDEQAGALSERENSATSAMRSGCSEFQNNISPMNARAGPGVVLNVGTTMAAPLKLKALSSISDKSYSLKSFKGATDAKVLKWALLEIELGDEPRAMGGILCILGSEVMEPNAWNPMGDGGKWRVRWRNSRAKTHRVMASLVEDLISGSVPIRKRGGRAQRLWEEFTGGTE